MVQRCWLIWLGLYLFTTCSTSSLSMSLPICAGPSPSGVSGGEEGDVGEGGTLVTSDAGVKLSVTGPLLDVSPLVTLGVAKYFLLLRFRRTRLFKIKSQGLLSNVSNSFSVSILTWEKNTAKCQQFSLVPLKNNILIWSPTYCTNYYALESPLLLLCTFIGQNI